MNVFTHPPALKAEINELVGDYPVDVKGFRTNDSTRTGCSDEIYST